MAHDPQVKCDTLSLEKEQFHRAKVHAMSLELAPLDIDVWLDLKQAAGVTGVETAACEAAIAVAGGCEAKGDFAGSTDVLGLGLVLEGACEVYEDSTGIADAGAVCRAGDRPEARATGFLAFTECRRRLALRRAEELGLVV